MIYFVRHGLSEANVKKVFAGQKDDSLLTDEGREQAKKTANKIIKENLKINKIISSPLLRAKETAQIIANVLDFKENDIVLDKRIIEYDMGSLSETPWHAISSKVLVNAKNAEDPNKFKERVIEAMREYDEFNDNILVVSHGGVGRMLETIRGNVDPSLFYDIPIWENGSITKIDWIK